MGTPVAPAESSARLSGAQPQQVVVFEDVSISFEGNTVLDGISFQLERGETKALLGVAGSGKSTILKLTMGLLKPDRGQIWVLGQEVSAMKERDLFELRRRIGMVFQESALFDSLTVAVVAPTRAIIREAFAVKDAQQQDWNQQIPDQGTSYFYCATSTGYSTARIGMVYSFSERTVTTLSPDLDD